MTAFADNDWDAVASGLATFLERSSATKPATPAARLSGFLRRYAELSSEAAIVAASVAPKLEAGSFHSTIAALSPVLTRARAAGAFFNLWSVAGLARDEVRTSAVLSWLLDPQASHGVGDVFARALWEQVGAVVGFDLDGLRRSSTELCPLGDGSNRVDVVLEGDDFLVFVEVKIDAPQQPDQLGRYVRAAKAAAELRNKSHYAVIYLAQRLEPVPPEQCWQITWRDVARAICRAARAQPASFAKDAAVQFAAHVETLH